MEGVITQYKCALCKTVYENAEDAVKCYSRGAFNPEVYVVGTMFEYSFNEYIGVFATAECASRYDTHSGEIYAWACRVTNAGDTLGKDMCGSWGVRSDAASVERWHKMHYMDTKLNSPEATRMINYLKSKGITPRYYDKEGRLHLIN